MTDSERGPTEDTYECVRCGSHESIPAPETGVIHVCDTCEKATRWEVIE